MVGHVDLNYVRNTLQDALQHAKDTGDTDLKPFSNEELEFFSNIMPELLAARNEGYSFNQISDLLTKAGFHFQPCTVRANFEFLLHKLVFKNLLEHEEQTKIIQELLDIPPGQKPSVFSKPIESGLALEKTGNWKCLPLPVGAKTFPLREKISPEVYEDEILEHPAIPGLMLTKAERVYWGYLEMVEKDSGQMRTESVKEMPFRAKWEKPIPRTESISGKNVVDMNMSLFKY
jgi:hypothetical protein